MNIKVIVLDGAKTYDLSQSVQSVSWDTTLLEQAGKCTFTYTDDGKTYITEGARVAITIDNVGLFSGFIFTRKRNNTANIEITAYDQMRYLQNKDIVNFPIMTASAIFKKIGTEQQLNHKVVHASSHNCAAKAHDNASYYEMIQYAIDETLYYTGKWYMVRDSFGTLEFLSIEKCLTPVILGDESLVSGFDFESSIDSDTYNQVKITKDNKETVKREVYIVKDSSNINRWGRLQLFEKAKEDANEAQIKEKANMLLALKNRPTRSLSLSCIGDKRVRAGNGIVLRIEALKNEGIPYNQNALVYSCTHDFKNDMHTMKLDLEIV